MLLRLLPVEYYRNKIPPHQKKHAHTNKKHSNNTHMQNSAAANQNLHTFVFFIFFNLLHVYSIQGKQKYIFFLSGIQCQGLNSCFIAHKIIILKKEKKKKDQAHVLKLQVCKVLTNTTDWIIQNHTLNRTRQSKQFI